jgi:hypothetical protein
VVWPAALEICSKVRLCVRVYALMLRRASHFESPICVGDLMVGTAWSQAAIGRQASAAKPIDAVAGGRTIAGVLATRASGG